MAEQGFIAAHPTLVSVVAAVVVFAIPTLLGVAGAWDVFERIRDAPRRHWHYTTGLHLCAFEGCRNMTVTVCILSVGTSYFFGTSWINYPLLVWALLGMVSTALLGRAIRRDVPEDAWRKQREGREHRR